jgi:hypothetical protein
MDEDLVSQAFGFVALGEVDPLSNTGARRRALLEQ